jgi:class 3 adenylate cyclase
MLRDTVNIFSRLQGLSKELGRDIIFSASTRYALGDEFRFESLETVQIKGKIEPVTAHALVKRIEHYRRNERNY